MSRLVSPSAKSIKALEAVALALKLVDKGVRRDISSTTRSELNPLWKETVSSHAGSNRMDQDILVKGSRVAAGNPSKAVAGASRRALSDGLVPVQWNAAWEFGSPNPNEYTTYERVHPRSLKSHTVRRRAKRQLPRANRKGRVVYPAWAEMGPRMTSLWVSIVVRNIHERLEGK